jgi:type IV pilus assembly protein PilM
MIFSKERDALGIDIGSSSIKLVEMRKSKKGFQLERLAIAPLPPEAIVDGALMDSVIIIDTIRDLISTSKTKTKDVVTSVSGHSVIVKKITLPLMNKDQLRETVQWEAERYIPFDINDVNIDFNILGPNPENPDLMDTVLVAAKKEVIDDYVSVMMESGLNPIIIDIDAFALENMLAINYEFGKEETVLIADIGSSITNINILQNNVSHFTRDIFKGGNQVTEEIQKQLHVDYEEAEKIKTGSQVDTTSQHLLQEILRNAAESFAAEIGNSLDFFKSTTSNVKISKLYLSGGGSKIKDLDVVLQQQIGIPVEIVNPFRKIEYNEKKFDLEYLREIGSIMGVGVGLASRRVGDR